MTVALPRHEWWKAVSRGMKARQGLRSSRDSLHEGYTRIRGFRSDLRRLSARVSLSRRGFVRGLKSSKLESPSSWSVGAAHRPHSVQTATLTSECELSKKIIIDGLFVQPGSSHEMLLSDPLPRRKETPTPPPPLSLRPFLAFPEDSQWPLVPPTARVDISLSTLL